MDCPGRARLPRHDLALAGGFASPARATSYPYVTQLHYESSASTSTLKAQGQEDAEAAGSNRGDVWVVLAFCRPAYSGTDWGTIACNTANFISLASIVNAVQAYTDGWHSVGPTGTYPFISFGSANDYLQSGSDNISACGAGGATCASEFGAAWASKEVQLANYISGHGYTNQSAAGGFDFEPAWDAEYNLSHDIATGYDGNASAGAYDDFGSADSSWSQQHIYTLSYGITDALPFPEIYYPDQDSTSSEWAGVDAWAHSNSDSYYVYGVLDNYNPGNGCTFTPDQTYDVLMGYIDSWQSAIPYAVDQAC